MTKHDDTYTCEHCGRWFYIGRINGNKGPVRYECTCGRMADRWPDIPLAFWRPFQT